MEMTPASGGGEERRQGAWQRSLQANQWQARGGAEGNTAAPGRREIQGVERERKEGRGVEGVWYDTDRQCRKSMRVSEPGLNLDLQSMPGIRRCGRGESSVRDPEASGRQAGRQAQAERQRSNPGMTIPRPRASEPKGARQMGCVFACACVRAWACPCACLLSVCVFLSVSVSVLWCSRPRRWRVGCCCCFAAGPARALCRADADVGGAPSAQLARGECERRGRQQALAQARARVRSEFLRGNARRRQVSAPRPSYQSRRQKRGQKGWCQIVQ